MFNPGRTEQLLRQCVRPGTLYSAVITLAAGAAMTLAFAPFGLSLLVFPLLAVLFGYWMQASPRQALLHGWLFALGMNCTGVSWIFFSLYYHGGSPAFLAVLMIILLSAYLAVYLALAGYAIRRFLPAHEPGSLLLLLFPAGWLAAEWLTGIVMTGFAWMQPGYTQIDLPLAGYAPLLGGHFVSAMVALSAAVLTGLVSRRLRPVTGAAVLLAIWLVGALLKTIDWTEPAGDPIRVAMIQGNIAQHEKWKIPVRKQAMERYRELTLEQQDVDLVIWPETAVADYRHRVSGFLVRLRQAMKERDTDLLLGLFIKDFDTGRYYNSVISVRGGEYLKRHLVPLGEYMPLRSLTEFFNQWIRIPMSDIASGPADQELLRVAGQPVGVNICFEDAFARDVRRDLPEATLLVNVSNDAWFEGSHEPAQHHAIARMRALETGRFLLRSTNTGISSVIGPDGGVVAISPASEEHVLRAEVQPLQGSTPYVRWGDAPAVLLALLVPVVVRAAKRRR